MEVASPLPFRHPSPVAVGAKRPFAGACAPLTVDPSVANPSNGPTDLDIDDTYACYGQQIFKRRRCDSPDGMNIDGATNMVSTNTSGASGALTTVPFLSPAFAANGNIPWQRQTAATGGITRSTKRSRFDSEIIDDWDRDESSEPGKSAAELQSVVDDQAAEIERLKTEKSSSESEVVALKSENERITNENKILKKAVGIQQERQNQAQAEIEQGRSLRADAEDRIRKLEQLILTLRYHLHAQQPCSGNDFMDLNRRPPDVF